MVETTGAVKRPSPTAQSAPEPAALPSVPALVVPGAPPAPAAPRLASPGIPPIVRRNTLLLAASQAIVGIGSQMVPTLAPVVIVRISGTEALLGFAVATMGISKLLAAYPVGQITDRFGRRAGLLLGSALSLVGALVLGASVLAWSLTMLIIGLLVFGAGFAANQQLRLAAADMYPPARRAEGLGFVLTGSLVGALLAPLLVVVAQALAPRAGIDEAALVWLLVPFTLVPSMALVAMIRPDPKDIASNLANYYPGLPGLASLSPLPAGRPLHDGSSASSATVTASTTQVSAPIQPAVVAGPAAWLREYPKLVVFSASAVAQGIMTLMMALTSVSLSHHGHAFSAISVSVAIHVVGMFGFSIPLGRLCDRIGRKPVLVGGLVVLAAGAILVPVSPAYWLATFGTFLVGVGWSGASVAASALIADTTAPSQRGRAIGLNDSCAAAGAVVFPILGGPIAAAFGLMAAGLVAAACTVPVLVMAVRLKRHVGQG